MPSARFGATRRSWKSPRGSGALDRALTVAAVAYYAAVIVFTILVRSGDLSASGIDSSADELADYCRGKIADFKIPWVVEIRDQLPKSPTGKVRKTALRAGGAQGAAESASS